MTPDQVPADSLRFTLSVPDAVRAGSEVSITLVLQNVSSRPIEVHLRGRETVFDVIVSRAGGDVVWSRLAGKATLAILQLRRMAPGERLELATTWNQRDSGGEPVAPGEYVVRGELPADDPIPLRSTESRLTIVAR